MYVCVYLMHACVYVFVSVSSSVEFHQFKIRSIGLWVDNLFRFLWKAYALVCFFTVYRLLLRLHTKVTIDYSKNTFLLCFIPARNSKWCGFNGNEKKTRKFCCLNETKQFSVNWTTRVHKHVDALRHCIKLGFKCSYFSSALWSHIYGEKYSLICKT